MKRIRTAQELYNEILKSFYFGIYQKDARLMTYQEACQTYNLTKDTIGRAYAMLRRDGFIRTDGANGTIVTFDLNNPAHVAKVPLVWSDSVPESAVHYEVTMQLHAYSLYTGLVNSGDAQLQKCKEFIGDILKRVKCELPYYEQVFAFWVCVISSLENELLNHITDHFISRYLYLLPPLRLTQAQRHLIGKSALEYYEFLTYAIEHRDFEQFTEMFERHYYNYYQYGGVAFSKLEDVKVLKDQTLYGRLLSDLCIKIMSGEISKGNALPTTKYLCTKYGVSKTTVNRAYGILADMGLISRHVRRGTKLIVELDDPTIWEKLENTTGLHQRNWRDALEVLIIINRALCRRIVIVPKVVEQMKMELARQSNLSERYGTPYFISAALFSPLMASLPIGILHKYYLHLTEVLDRFLILCAFRVRRIEEHGKEIYKLMCNALEALECDDQEAFATLSEHAVRRYAELLTEDYACAIKEIKKQKAMSVDV